MYQPRRRLSQIRAQNELYTHFVSATYLPRCYAVLAET